MLRTVCMLFSAAALVLASCARDDQRAKPYDEHKCPFCTVHPGRCSYCKHPGKCFFCKGMGKIKVSWSASPENNMQAGFSEEQCVFCKGTGICAYCGGSGKCRVCKGSAVIHSWNFYDTANTQR